MTPERLRHHLDEARTALEPAWTPARADHVRARIPAGRRRHRRQRVAARLATGACLLAIGVILGSALRREPSAAPAPVEIVALRPVEPAPLVIEARQEPVRSKRVDARAEVEASSTRVLVDRQRSSAGVTISSDAESRREGPADARPEPEATPSTPPIPSEQPRVELSTLLRQADEARSAGRLVTAASILRQVVRAHPDDPRTPVASISLGRLLLEELDSPMEAFAAFSQARAAAPDSALAEDAFAREVECLARAQDPRLADHARAFEAAFPQSARLARVRHLGGSR
ncbi:MAG: hypothetical protein MUC96_16120 [Myxococcaceae bacterium]|jgi:TolA-binding protein|nr:hypothetical protein [Myxococcaceae bacterium]